MACRVAKTQVTSKEWRDRNAGLLRDRARERYAREAEHNRERGREYYRQNREKKLAYYAENKERILARAGKGRSIRRCERCGEPATSQRHHLCDRCRERSKMKRNRVALMSEQRVDQRRRYFRERPKTTAERGYGNEHQKLRRRWAKVIANSGTACARCGCWINPGELWDLGHDDLDRTKYRGPEHRGCNRKTANRSRKVRRWEAGVKRASRDW